MRITRARRHPDRIEIAIEDGDRTHFIPLDAGLTDDEARDRAIAFAFDARPADAPAEPERDPDGVPLPFEDDDVDDVEAEAARDRITVSPDDTQEEEV